MTQTNLESQIIALQSQVAFMEDTLDTLDTLNAIVTAQSQQLADQQRQLQLLFQKITSSDNASQIQPFDLMNDRPPHY